MKKNQANWPSILYKRPISKNSFLYHSIISNYNSHKPELNIITNDEEQILKNNLTETVRTEGNKQKFNYLYSNFNKFKKLNGNYPYSTSSRYSTKNKILTSRKREVNEFPNSNSLLFQNKSNIGKIYPNYNNMCNISLNQHFYNIDYNNFTSSDSIKKKDDLKNLIEKLKTQRKNKPTPEIKNNYNRTHRSNSNKKNILNVNSLNNNFSINLIKNVNNSYDSFDSNFNTYIFNNAISKKKKKSNIINLFSDENEQFFYQNKTSDLGNYTNFTKTHRIRKDKINLTNNEYKDDWHQIYNTDAYNFKYKKKIVNHNSFIKTNNNTINKMQFNNNVPFSYYKKQIISLNKTHEQINDNNRTIASSYIGSTKNNNLNNFHSFFNLSKLYNINKKINQDFDIKCKTKRSFSKNVSEKKKLLTTIPIFNTPLVEFNKNSKKFKINNSILKNHSINEKNYDTNNYSIPKIDNISNSIVKNNKILINVKKETSRKNTNKSNKISLEEYASKKNNNGFPNNKSKLKKIDLNKLMNNGKKNSKLSIMSVKRKKETTNIKKIFNNSFSTEVNNTITSPSSNRNINLNQNKNILNYINNKQKKNVINNDNIINTSLRDILKNIRKPKNKIEKKNDLTPNHYIKINLINKKNNYIINQPTNQNNINANKNKNKIHPQIHTNNPSLSSDSSNKAKEINEFMVQSQKLSEYIKEYYAKNSNYPPTKLDFYRIGRIIGQGGFAKVNLGLNVLTGRVVAIKSFNKNIKTKYGDKLNLDKILYEINLMRKLNHQNITKILETFEDEQFYFIIMEYINGGNLFSYVKKRRKLSEKVAKFIFRQIILGIKHIHSQLIVHRDIKLENILIDMNKNIKICDFGIGIILSSENQLLHSHCGTPMYIAPEIILSTKEKGYKGFPVDIWSAGIALYIMISGKLPFNLNESPDDLDSVNKNKDNKEKNKKLKYEILNNEPKYIENISDELRDLLKGLLNKDPDKRLTCEQILNHPWLDDVDSHKINLFSKAEKKSLTKTFMDYRKRKFEDLIENFTFSNLFKDTKSVDEKYNCETKSSLLAPFNSINFEFFNLGNINIQKRESTDEFDDSKNKKLMIEQDVCCFANKAKELNFQYELDNNKEVDNGVLINNKSNAESNSSSFSIANSKRNFINDKSINLNFENNEMNLTNNQAERIISQIENFGYDREYVIRSLKNNYLNHATTIYFLLMNYEKI